MIYIEDTENVPLPKKYHKVNNLCAIFYDQITEIFKADNYDALNGTEIDFDKNKHILIDDLQKGKIHGLDWLKINKLDDELTTILVKHIAMSIISDFVNFIYESLSCAKKGKMTVAYALLRKPFTDELLILEQLLYEPADFIQRFYHIGNPTEYDPSSRNNDKRKIIRNAISKVKPNLLFTEELLFNLRYDKSSKAGINWISNHALHIVTKDKNYKTQDQNFNFVFSTEDDIVDYWDHYYEFVPYLLMYATAIIDNIIFQYLPGKANDDLKAVKSFRQFIGLVLWSERDGNAAIKGGDASKSHVNLFDIFTSVIKLDCKKCNRKVEFSRPDFELFFESEIFLCPKCFSDLLSTAESVKPIKEFIKSMSLINQV